MATIKPIDREIIAAPPGKPAPTSPLRSTTSSAAWAARWPEVVCETCPVPVERVGVEDVFGKSGPAAELLELYGSTPRTSSPRPRPPWRGNKVSAPLCEKRLAWGILWKGGCPKLRYMRGCRADRVYPGGAVRPSRGQMDWVRGKGRGKLAGGAARWPFFKVGKEPLKKGESPL